MNYFKLHSRKGTALTLRWALHTWHKVSVLLNRKAYVNFSLATSKCTVQKQDKANTVLVFISFLVLSQRSSLMLHAPTSQTSSSLVHVQFSFYTIWLTSFYTIRNRPLCLLCTVKDFSTFRLDCIKSLKVIMSACRRQTVSHPPSTKAMQVWMRHPKSAQHTDWECVHWAVLFTLKSCLLFVKYVWHVRSVSHQLVQKVILLMNKLVFIVQHMC